MHSPICAVQGEWGPFRPNFPVEVPLWLALALQKKRCCRIQIPAWMKVEHLEGDHCLQLQYTAASLHVHLSASPHTTQHPLQHAGHLSSNLQQDCTCHAEDILTALFCSLLSIAQLCPPQRLLLHSSTIECYVCEQMCWQKSKHMRPSFSHCHFTT